MINALVSLHDRIFAALERVAGRSFLGVFARLAFGSVTLVYFWSSAMTKICQKDWTAPGQPQVCNPLAISDGAYGQILPWRFNAVEGDVSQLGMLDHIIVHAGTYAEFILPLLVVIGLFTRLTSLGMIGFIAVMTIVDITGHGAAFGGMFNRAADELIADQRLLWLFPLIYLVVRGAGRFSVDGLLARRWPRGD